MSHPIITSSQEREARDGRELADRDDVERRCVHGYVHEDGHHHVTSSYGGGENFTTSARWEPCPEQAEADVRAFAEAFPTVNVLRAITLCESGRLSWTVVHDLFRTSTAKALAELTR